MLLSSPPERHTLLDDIQGLLVGTGLVALSVTLLRGAELITGQIAGASLILGYVGDWSFGTWFFLLNLPFYALAIVRMGWRFTVKTFCAVALLSLFTELMPAAITFEHLSRPVAGILGGVTAGAGLLALFRHGASLGGVGIVALYLQDRHNIRAGVTQLIFDAGVFLAAVLLFDPETVFYSLIGAVVLNIIIATNHRRDRYIAR
jgi:uncharacterized membrane-anchored protein YitT (DUF2179 family)